MGGGRHQEQSDSEYFADFTRRVSEARIPLDGSIELTHRCNLRCVHCYLGDQNSIRRHRRDELSRDEIITLIDEIVDAGALNLTFSGGDPMVRKDFPDIYTHAVKKGLLVTVFCDGVLITERIRSLFREYPPRKVEVSIYGATRETYEGITQVKGSFAGCLAGIRRLHEDGHRFTLKTVLMRQNRHELQAMRALAEGLGVDFYFDTAVFPCLPHGDNGGHANRAQTQAIAASVDVAPPSRSRPLDFRLSPEDAATAQLADPRKVDEMASLYLRTRGAPASEYLYTCGAGLTTFHVDPYGNLQPCTISTNVRYNLREGGFMKGWNGPIAAIREIRANPDSGCRTCDMQALCSGCPAFFHAESGSADRKSEHVCRTTHALFEGLEGALSGMLQSRS